MVPSRDEVRAGLVLLEERTRPDPVRERRKRPIAELLYEHRPSGFRVWIEVPKNPRPLYERMRGEAADNAAKLIRRLMLEKAEDE